MTWEQDAFAFADSYDKEAGRYRGLRVGQVVTLPDADTPGLLVQPDVAREQLDAESKKAPGEPTVPGGEPRPGAETGGGGETGAGGDITHPPKAAQPKRFHGTVELDATRVGRDASRIADEVISHVAGLVGAKVTVTLEIEAEIPSGAPDHVVRTVTENGRTLKFTSQGFEKE